MTAVGQPWKMPGTQSVGRTLQAEGGPLAARFGHCYSFTHESLPLPLHGHNLFFDAAGGDQFVDKHRLILANPMGAIRSLVFRCRVPPRVVMDDSVCGGEVQTYTPGLQTDQEDRYFFVAEPLRAAGCGSTGIGSARPKQRSGGVQPMKRPVVHRL